MGQLASCLQSNTIRATTNWAFFMHHVLYFKLYGRPSTKPCNSPNRYNQFSDEENKAGRYPVSAQDHSSRDAWSQDGSMYS